MWIDHSSCRLLLGARLPGCWAIRARFVPLPGLLIARFLLASMVIGFLPPSAITPRLAAAIITFPPTIAMYLATPDRLHSIDMTLINTEGKWLSYGRDGPRWLGQEQASGKRCCKNTQALGDHFFVLSFGALAKPIQRARLSDRRSDCRRFDVEQNHM
jgi:hypothetical protein